MVFRDVQKEHSTRSFKFTEVCVWIKVEGTPIGCNAIEVAITTIQRIGRILYFDEESKKEGTKQFVSALV